MSRSRWLLLALAAVAFLGFWLASAPLGVDGSSLSVGDGGWLAARQYLEAGGAEVELLYEAPDEQTGVLVVVLPWQRRAGEGEIEALEDHLRRGGTLLLAYAGSASDPTEAAVLGRFQVEMASSGESPLLPWRWWSTWRRPWQLQPQSGIGGGTLQIAALRRVPRPPARARVLYRGGPEGGAEADLVCDYTFLGGRVVLMPADLLANGRLAKASNADFLASLASQLGPVWAFDEWHHQLMTQDSEVEPAVVRGWWMGLAHLLVLYLAAVWVLGRRFGPAWAERLPSAGSSAGFLRSLGALHRRLDHREAAAELLVQRAGALDPRLNLPSELGSEQAVRNDRELLELAQRVGRWQQGRGT